MTSSERQYNAINNLPENPTKPIVWIVYNEDMVNGVSELIGKIKGLSYLRNNVYVVSRRDSTKYEGTIHFDPTLYDLLGNGNG